MREIGIECETMKDGEEKIVVSQVREVLGLMRRHECVTLSRARSGKRAIKEISP